MNIRLLIPPDRIVDFSLAVLFHPFDEILSAAVLVIEARYFRGKNTPIVLEGERERERAVFSRN